jgi:hypothetical protein
MSKNIFVPNRNNFKLSKAKLDKDGGITINYEVVESIDDQVYSKKFMVESSVDVHPDLKQLYKDLRPIVARTYNFGMITTLIESKEFKATKAQAEAGRKLYEQLLERITINGISLSGNDDNIGVVVSASYKVKNDQVTAINTPRIKFNTESFGFETELEGILEGVEEEVYLYLFEGKKAQLELFGANNEPVSHEHKEVTDEDEGAEDEEGANFDPNDFEDLDV